MQGTCCGSVLRVLEWVCMKKVRVNMCVRVCVCVCVFVCLCVTLCMWVCVSLCESLSIEVSDVVNVTGAWF